MTSSPHVGMLAGHVLLRIVDYVAAHGHDPESLCRAVGLSVSALSAPDARVPYTLAEELSLRAIALVPDPNLGLHLAQALENRRPQRFDAGVLMMMASPTLGAGIERLAHYQRFWGDGSRARLQRLADGLRLRYRMHATSPIYQRHIDECALADILIGARLLTAHKIAPRSVRFRHRAPDDIREHTALFQCQITFGAEHTELELDQRSLDLRMPHANETYRAVFQDQVERALARLPAAGAAGDVRGAAEAALASGQCSLSGTARNLGVSPRTLQRRLHADGTSFEALVDALRCELAAKYLDEQLPIQEIAWLLGYADASAFHRAWKRWTGTTPEQARGTRGHSA